MDSLPQSEKASVESRAKAYPDITRIGKDDSAQIIFGNTFKNCRERICGQSPNSLVFDNR